MIYQRRISRSGLLLVVAFAFAGCEGEQLVAGGPTGSGATTTTTTGKTTQNNSTSSSPTQGSSNTTGQVPTLESSWEDALRSADVAVDEAKLEGSGLVTTSKSGHVEELESLESLTKYWLSDDIDNTPLADNGTFPASVNFSVRQTNHQGEMQIINALRPEDPFIMTVETINGQPLAHVDLVAEGTFTSSSSQGTFLNIAIPNGTDPVPGFLFLCVDGNKDGSCADERVKNLNFFLNMLYASEEDAPPENVETGSVAAALFGGGFSNAAALRFKALGQGENKGLLIYSQAVTIDPVKKTITARTETPAFFLSQQGDATTVPAGEVVANIYDFILGMTSSYPVAVEPGTEIAGVPRPVSIGVLLADYCMDCDSFGEEVSLGDAYAEAAAQRKTLSEYAAKHPGTGREWTGSTEASGTERSVRPPSIVNRDGSIYCQERCACDGLDPVCNKITQDGTAAQGLAKKEPSECAKSCECTLKADKKSGGVYKYKYKCNNPEIRTNGCFAEGTSIRTADRQEVPIEVLSKGQQILMQNGQRAAILRIVAGPERDPLYTFYLKDGARLSVTATHPMLTLRGMQQAQHLQQYDMLSTAAHGYVSIVRIQREATTRPVYNIEIERTATNTGKDNGIIANGVATGDLADQQRLARGESGRSTAQNAKLLRTAGVR